MARLDDLEFRITATTDSLRTELNRASGTIDKFARDSESRFSSMQNRFTQVAGKIRSTFALFGVGFGANAFAGWIKSATEVEKLTSSQAEKLKGAKDAMAGLQTATDGLAQSIATNLAPALEKAAKFWTQIFDSNERRGAFDNTKLALLNGALSQKIEELKKLQSGGKGGMNAEIEIRQTIDRIMAEISAMNGTAAASSTDTTIGQKKWDDFLDTLGINPDFYTKPRDKGFDFQGAIRQVGQSQLQPINPQDFLTNNRMGLNFQGQPEAILSMGPVNAAFEKSSEQFAKLNKQMEEGERRSKAFADSFASIGESRGIQAILDGDVSGAIRGLAKDFLELTLRLAVLRPLAEGVAGFLTGGGSFFGSLFGGIKGHASGGRMGAGEVGWVGESGKELFVPDVPGRILTHSQSMAMVGGGRGVVVQQSFYNQYGSGPQYDADLMNTAQIAAKTAYDAVMKTLGGRR